MKRCSLRFILCGLLVMAMLSVAFLAAPPAQAAELTKSDDGYYQIYTADDLYAFAKMVNSGNTEINGRLMKNIVVNKNVLKSDGTLNGDGSNFREWTPIGKYVGDVYDYCYRGIFDGNGKTVSGLYINDSDIDYVGLFGYTYFAEINNVGVINSYFKGKDYVGGIVGCAYWSDTTNCYNTGSVTGNDYVGGVVGYAVLGNTTNCYNTGSVTGNSDVGGVVGYAGYSSDTTNCHNTGSVTGNSDVGGVVGQAEDSDTTDCYNTGSVTGNSDVGGVVGYAEGSNTTKCYNTGSVSGTGDSVGGVVGEAGYSDTTKCYNTGSVTGNGDVGGVVGYAGYSSDTTNCHNTGSVSGTGYYAGGVVGYAVHWSNITDCYNTGSVTGSNYVSGVVGGAYDYSYTTNCYYLLGTAKNGKGDDADSDGTTQVKTAEQFKSGEVAYLLSSGTTDGTQVWYQTIGIQATPQFQGKTVYQVTDCQGGVAYGNTNGEVRHIYGGDPVCDFCGAKCSHKYSKGTCTICGYKPTPAKVTKKPVSVTVAKGESAKVTVKATGDGLTYTWYYKDAGAKSYTKSTAKSASYAISMYPSRHNRSVYCVITDKYGNEVKTSTVYLRLAATVTKQPATVTVASGKTAKVSVEAVGNGLTYTWYYKNPGDKSFTKSSIKKATYSMTMYGSKSGRQVYCVVKDKYGNEVKTKTVSLEIKLAITKQPTNTAVLKGETAKVTVKAVGEGLTYTWYYKNPGDKTSTKSSNKTATYSVTMNASRNGRWVYCIVKDKYGNSVKTDAVKLTMAKVMKITKQPASVSVAYGKTATIKVTATGTNLKYQWYIKKAGESSYTKVPSTTNTNTLKLKMDNSFRGARVFCKITDYSGKQVKTDTVTMKCTTKKLTATFDHMDGLTLGNWGWEPFADIEAQGVGGSGGYQYKFEVFANGSTTPGLVEDFSTTNSFGFTATTSLSGVVVRITVKDSVGQQTVYEMDADTGTILNQYSI